MQTNNKPTALAKEMFDFSDSISKVSRTGNLYGKLEILLDFKQFVLEQELKIRKQIKESEERV